MMVLCGWCGITLEEGTLPASHGICPSCAAQTFKAEDEPLIRGIALERARFYTPRTVKLFQGNA